MKAKKSDLHAPMGAAEKAVGERDGVSPHYTEHPEKLSRAPIPGGTGQYHAGNEVIGQVPNGVTEDRRVPSNPTGADGFTEHPEKVATQGKADHRGARGRDYNEEAVRDAQPQTRTELVPESKRPGAGDDRKTISNQSSFGGKPWKS